jgi:hypothetical protein
MKVYELSYGVRTGFSIYEYNVSKIEKNCFVCDIGDKKSGFSEIYDISRFLLNNIISCENDSSGYYNLVFIDSKNKERQIKRFEKFILNSVDEEIKHLKRRKKIVESHFRKN